MKIDFKINYFSLSLLLFIVAACNSGGEKDTNNQKRMSNAISAINDKQGKINLVWTIDNNVKPADINSSLRDLGWHLVTLTVSSVDSSSVLTPVEGLLAGIYPAPVINLGQQVLIQDINCESAIFSQVGDSCSSYFKLNYDMSKSASLVQFPVKMAPKGEIKAVLAFNSSFQPKQSITDYRSISAHEQKYYTPSAIASNKAAYQIFKIQNGSLPALSLTTLQSPTNPSFTLLHRSNSDSDDPYYASQDECAMTNNPALLQTNTLASLNESCILVYQASVTATQPQESDLITVTTNSEYKFPAWANRYNLVANYVNGTPLPAQAISDLQAVFHEILPFSSFYINYNFTPQKLPILDNSTSMALILPSYINLQTNQEILSNIASIAKITLVVPEFINGQALRGESARVNACGGAWASVAANVYAFQDITKQNAVTLTFSSNSSGHCGNPAPEYKVIYLPFSGSAEQTVYHIDDTGCDGGHWDMGGTVTIKGGCVNGRCNYPVTLTAHHGGVGGECQDTKSVQFSLDFPQPTTNNIAYLDSLINSSISFAALGGQSSSGAIGGLSGPIAQSIACDQNGNCAASGSYRNDLISQDMGYQINLNSGDTLNNGTIQFTRSSGYDLNSFAIQIRQEQSSTKSFKVKPMILK